MDDKKYQIFVSSTYKDLIEARNKIIETVLSLYHFPVGMEMFSADDSEQWEIIEETINVSDYYVIIIGHRYGSVTTDGVSYTEKEYDYAKEKGLPILAFIRNRNISTHPDERESSPDATRKLDAFIEKATASKMCDFWDNIDDLATKVAIALPKIFRRNPQVGWVRGSEALSKEISQELAELSTENRGLRNKLRELESLNSQIKPLIEVHINSTDSLSLACRDLDLDPNKLLSLPKPLSIKSIPKRLAQYINNDEIIEYNKNLPTKNAIDDYNSSLKLFNMASNESIKLRFDISNIGKAKANDAFVTLKFPGFVRVIEKDDFEDISPPKNPLPKSPIEKAEEKYKSRLMSMAVVNQHGSMFNTRLPNIRSLTGPNINFWSSVKDNEVTLRLNSLVHTRMRSFNKRNTETPTLRKT